jgi:hypothetical protein
MSEKKLVGNNGVGFIACYKGKAIASSPNFKDLANQEKVKILLGNKNLVIKHNVPEGLVAIY